jgi:hypothetical protein
MFLAVCVAAFLNNLSVWLDLKNFGNVNGGVCVCESVYGAYFSWKALKLLEVGKNSFST